MNHDQDTEDDNGLPTSDDAEISLVSSCMFDPRYIDDVLLAVSPDDFFQSHLRTIFRTVVQLHNSGKFVDAMMVKTKLRNTKSTTGKKGVTAYDDIGGDEVFDPIARTMPSGANGAYYAGKVRNLSIRRQIIGLGSDAIHAANVVDGESDQILSKLESSIFALRDLSIKPDCVSLESLLIPLCDDLQARMGNRGLQGISTGLFGVDKITHGFCNGQLIILAARPAVGKTALALQMAAAFASSGKKVLFVSLEMTKKQLTERVLLGTANVNTNRVMNGYHDANDMQRITMAAAKVAPLNIWLETSDSTPSQLAAIARRMRRSKDGLGLIVVDYLQLVRPEDRRMPREQQISEISRRLKSLTIEMDIPILCLAQLNRQAESGNLEPQLHFLRESGAIEQDADQVWMIWKEETDLGNGKKDVVHKLKIAKNRHGRAGVVKLQWVEDRLQFEDATETKQSAEYVSQMSPDSADFMDQFN
jgi:replicative DNA helicase